MIDDVRVREHRDRALTPDRPCCAVPHKTDVFFQAREAANPFYFACPTIVQQVMDRFASGRAVLIISSNTQVPPTPSG
jgi:pyruvate-ferredoxin/flavodoxin oxidoreductase